MHNQLWQTDEVAAIALEQLGFQHVGDTSLAHYMLQWFDIEVQFEEVSSGTLS